MRIARKQRYWVALVMAALLAACSTDSAPPASQAPPVAVTPGISLLAGKPGGGGSRDGIGADARFLGLSGVAVDGAGNLFVADNANHTIRKVTPGGEVTTLAGTAGMAGLVDGTGAAARFSYPHDIVINSAGELFISESDFGDGRIRKITPAGVVTTLALTAEGSALPVSLVFPTGLALDGDDNLYVVDKGNDTLYKVAPDGVTTLLAGAAGQPGTDDGAGADARFDSPEGLAIDSDGNLFVADQFSFTIRRVTPAGVVSTFVAADAGLQGPTDVAVDSLGNVFVLDSLASSVKKVTPGGGVSVFAGAPQFGSRDGTGTDARFSYPVGLTIDGDDNLFVADSGNSVLRKVTPAAVVTTPAGAAMLSGTDDGLGEAARFRSPRAMLMGADDNLLVADSSNHTIRSITPAGDTQTYAGLGGVSGTANGTRDAARFNLPSGLARDAAGNLYVADTSNHVIRKITPDGTVSTFAGTAGSQGAVDDVGADARFRSPRALVIDKAGNLFVADSSNHALRKITPGGVVSTIAGMAGSSGSADGTGAAARFFLPSSLAIDGQDNLYVASSSGYTLRKITPAAVVTTVAGTSGAPGFANGLGAAARFSVIEGLASDTAGNVFVADAGNRVIRKVTPTGAVTTVAGTPGQQGVMPGALPGTLAYMNAIAIDRQGALYVMAENSVLKVVLAP